MINQEASNRLKQWMRNGCDGMTDERLGYIEGWFHKSDKEAFELAISALEQEPKTDRIEYGTDGNAYKLWMSNGKEYEPSGDAISRQEVLELVADYDLSMGQVVKGIHALPSVKQEPKTGQYEKHIDHTDCIWYGNDSGCPVTCSQYRDGWNDAMDYIFKNGKGYQPYRHNV